MNIEQIVGRVDAGFAKAKKDLSDLVAIPSVSADSFDQNTLKESANWVAERARDLGLDTEVIQLKTASGLVGRPAILATRKAEPGKPTVMLYAHHDVQPTGARELWDTEPFEATEIGDRMFGRGTADDKAGVVLHLAAIAAADPGVGITMFIEGEEEVGSPTFVDFLNTYKERLQADAIIVADSNNWKVGTPSLTASLRGVAQVKAKLSVLDHALHSGMYGGPVLDAVTLASRLISTMHDDDGNVAIGGLLHKDEVDVDYPEADLRADTGILDGVEFAGSGSLTSRLWTKPALSVIAMDVTPVDLASNTLIPSVEFVLSLRVAPGQNSKEAGELLMKHMKDNVPFGAHLEVKLSEAGPAYSAGEDGPAREVARWALGEAWGTDPVDIGVGGSIPFISDLAEVFPEAEVLVTGVEDPDTRAHSANESLHLGDWRNAILAEALLLSKLGE